MNARAITSRSSFVLSPSGDGSDPFSGPLIPPHPHGRLLRTALPALVCGLLFWQTTAAAQADPFVDQRRSMVENQLRKRGIEQPAILAAMGEVPRHLFVPEGVRQRAYEDVPVPFAPGKALSQAYLSGLMISLLSLDPGDKVLEIGTGSGYDAAVLSRVVREVYTMEIDEALAERARRTLGTLGYDNVKVRTGDGYRGWSEVGPFDAILVTAAAQRIPEPLLEQLRVGGRMVVAVGDFVQDLQVITKTPEGRETRRISPVVLGPMTGEVNEGGEGR